MPLTVPASLCSAKVPIYKLPWSQVYKRVAGRPMSLHGLTGRKPVAPSPRPEVCTAKQALKV